MNHKLSWFRVNTASLCSYCNQHDETVQHFVSSCNQLISLWTEIKLYFVNDIKIIALSSQIAILGDTNTDEKCFITQNLVLLIFEFYVYNSRLTGNLSFSALFHKLVKIKNLERGTALRNQGKLDVYEKKWSFIENALQYE